MLRSFGLFRINEIKPINIEGGYLIDGFPSVGFTGAIATESMVRTTQFDLGGFLDSDKFPAISVIREGKPNLPTRIFVNNKLNVAVFSSYLTFTETLHKAMARTMLNWAKKHKVEYVISNVPVQSKIDNEKTMAVGSTDAARNKIKEAGIDILEHGAIPGIPGALLNQGMINQQNVIVILFNTNQTGSDFKSSAQLCMTMSKLVPGVSCDIPALQKEAEKAEQSIKEAEQETKNLSDGMYR